MIDNMLKVNQLIDIEINRPKNNGQPSVELYSSRIEDKTPDTLTLAYPLKNGYPVPVRNNEFIKIKLIYKNDIYAGEVKVISQARLPILLIKVTKPERMEKIQLRSWVRHPCEIPVKYVVLNQDSTKYSTISLDISGGGILILTKEAYGINTPLYLEFSIDDCLIKTIGNVVRTVPQDKEYKTAIEFEKIKLGEREQIVKYIFQKQREMLKRNIL